MKRSILMTCFSPYTHHLLIRSSARRFSVSWIFWLMCLKFPSGIKDERRLPRNLFSLYGLLSCSSSSLLHELHTYVYLQWTRSPDFVPFEPRVTPAIAFSRNGESSDAIAKMQLQFFMCRPKCLSSSYEFSFLSPSYSSTMPKLSRSPSEPFA